MKVIFPDTNFFIQCKDITEIPWAQAFPGEEKILLIISKTVLDEIDRHKRDGNSRRARRAKKVNSLAREILKSATGKVSIREKHPIIEATFSPNDLASGALPKTLDVTRADAQIIAEMLQYKASIPNQKPCFLTHDTNPMIMAKHCGLEWYEIPDEWLLPPETDAKDKVIQELEKRVKELQDKSPQIEVAVIDQENVCGKNTCMEIVHYPSLSEDDIADLVEEVRKSCPMEKTFPKEEPNAEDPYVSYLTMPIKRLFETFVPPSDEEINNYKREKYPEWLKAVEDYFRTLPGILEMGNRDRFVTFAVDNTGFAAADSALIEIHALGEIMLIREFDDEERAEHSDALRLPPPPKPPKGRWQKQAFELLMMQEQQRLSLFSPGEKSKIPSIGRRDKNEIYWKPGKPEGPQKDWRFECEEFRHQSGKRLFRVGIGAKDYEKEIYEGALQCVVSAKNLPRPVEQTIKIRVKVVRGNTKAEVVSHYKWKSHYCEIESNL